MLESATSPRSNAARYFFPSHPCWWDGCFFPHHNRARNMFLKLLGVRRSSFRTSAFCLALNQRVVITRVLSLGLAVILASETSSTLPMVRCTWQVPLGRLDAVGIIWALAIGRFDLLDPLIVGFFWFVHRAPCWSRLLPSGPPLWLLLTFGLAWIHSGFCSAIITGISPDSLSNPWLCFRADRTLV